MLRRLLDGDLYPHGVKVEHHTGYPHTDGCALIIPGRYWADHTEQVNEAIARYKWVLAFLTSDEENWFDHRKVTHSNLRWWIQTPRTGRDYGDARLFGVGFPKHFNDLSGDVPEKDMDVVLVAQNTHDRRRECFEALEKTAGSQFVYATAGFTQSWRDGAGPGDYAFQMMGAKVAPAPSGAVSPDSFRLWEALEAHAIPIADDISPLETYDSRGFWEKLLPDAPFPVLTEYADLSGIIDGALAGWPANTNRVAAWWMREKRRIASDFVKDLTELGAL